ncbi:hypothetical protein GCM10010172_19810 [Paractinoplanes ferrugineus]|uniref:Uncharacterized protein n=1 Tax=Paractinoplanes ferrugineus TaxID=113564 RepID=A0A919MA03_9ACTN|nr:hypothetical protein [Actinoplanes ferrugineus]GIE12076.1 hypothetical protein Afe05nite_39160 [Actinoplanes ferrugineus]
MDPAVRGPGPGVRGLAPGAGDCAGGGTDGAGNAAGTDGLTEKRAALLAGVAIGAGESAEGTGAGGSGGRSVGGWSVGGRSVGGWAGIEAYGSAVTRFSPSRRVLTAYPPPPETAARTTAPSESHWRRLGRRPGAACLPM